MKTSTPRLWPILLAISTATAFAQLGGFQNPLKKPPVQLPSTPTVTPKNQPIPSPVEELAKQDIRKSKAIGQVAGGVVGGVGGYFLAKEVTDNKQERVLITAAGAGTGVVIGGAIGQKIGATAAERRRQYARESAFLESEIAASEKAVAVRQQNLDQTKTEIARTQARIDELKAKSALTQAEKKEAGKLKADTEKRIEENKILLAQFEEKIGYLTHALDTSKAEANATAEEKADWERKRLALDDKKKQLVVQYTAVKEQSDQLAGNHKILENMVGS